MAMGIARSTALAGAVAAALLCLSLFCELARADSADFAFGSTESLDDYATVTLQEGNKPVSPSTNGFQGRITNNSFNFAGPDRNTDYLAGVYNGSSYRDFFAFNTAGANSTVTGAKSTLYSGVITAELSYSLFGATQVIKQLANGVSPSAMLYAELGQGVKYGSIVVDAGNSLRSLVLTLNSAAVSDINKTIAGNKRAVAIAGVAVGVPEPSTWVMILAGFAGLGFAATRRMPNSPVAAAVG
jgi:PEP-CTERM motif